MKSGFPIKFVICSLFDVTGTIFFQSNEISGAITISSTLSTCRIGSFLKDPKQPKNIMVKKHTKNNLE